jgi:hypothetical protein
MVNQAITELERGLPKLEKTSYSSIDKLMRTIMKKYDLTAKELHNGFVNKHNKTPDEWIKGKKMKTFKEFCEELKPLPIEAMDNQSKKHRLSGIEALKSGNLKKAWEITDELGTMSRIALRGV